MPRPERKKKPRTFKVWVNPFFLKTLDTFQGLWVLDARKHHFEPDTGWKKATLTLPPTSNPRKRHD